MAKELNVSRKELRHRCDCVQQAGAQNKGPEEWHLQHVFSCKAGLLDCFLVCFFCQFSFHCCGIEGHTIGKGSALLRGALNEDSDKGNGADCDCDAEYHVEGSPALKVGTKNELANDVPDDSANAGHCKYNAGYGAVVSVEPAA